MSIKRGIFSLLVSICISTFCYAQDLKAGDITVSHISGNTFESTVTLYQNTSTFVNRPYIILNWGESALDTLLSSVTGCDDSNTVTQVYQGIHTYSGAGSDTLWCAENYRMDNIQNISNSINEKLLLKYDLKVGLPGVNNSSPVFANCAHATWECCNWVYNPGASDPDNDSLSYKLIQPFTTNYTFPNAAVDSLNGNIIFNPVATGFYSFCMQIDEWKNFNSTYILVGTTYRQIQIDVYSLTGINEYVDPVEMNIYPNPFTNEAVLTIDHPVKNASLRISNCLSQTIREIENVNEKSIVLKRGNFSKGIYFVQLVKDNQIMASKKLIITD